MIRRKLSETHQRMAPEDIALCQRVYDHVCAARQISLDWHREELADRILQAFRHGVKDEDTLTRLVL